ncbi:MAG: polysaccharide deacetylase family protein [Bacteroidia bacterium]|jgi:peptidoglycan/xylan/chitin deacetylase (PgdA/CDA1 family)
MKFRLALLCFFMECITVVMLVRFIGISWWWLLVPVIGLKILVIWGSATIRSNFYTTVFSSSVTSEKIIAISFDDGPHPEYTGKILSVLEKHKAPATFFVIGKNIQGNEHLIRKINDQGHLLGNHSWSHSFFIDFKGKKAFMEELNATSDAVYTIIHKRMRFFRPPYGVTTPHLSAASNALKYAIIGWSIRSLDTTSDSLEKIAKRVTSQLKPGALILFHDTSEKTIGVLEQTLNFAKENGFKIVSVEQLLKMNAYQ